MGLMEASDPRKQFALEVFTTARASLPIFTRNGTNGNTNGHKTRAWWKQAERGNDARDENGKHDTE